MSKSETKVLPIADYVLLQRSAPEAKIGAIYIPEQARAKAQTANIIAVGPGRVLENGRRLEPSVKPGDVVWIEKWSGKEIVVDGVEHLFVRESELLGVSE